MNAQTAMLALVRLARVTLQDHVMNSKLYDKIIEQLIRTIYIQKQFLSAKLFTICEPDGLEPKNESTVLRLRKNQ